MRLISIVLFCVFTSANTLAQEQIKQGVYSFGGSVYYSSITKDYGNYALTQSTYTISPSISYFFIDQCELSFGIAYATSYDDLIISYEEWSSFSTVQIIEECKRRSLALNLGMRYYIPCGKVSPFIGASGQISWTTPYYNPDYHLSHLNWRYESSQSPSFLPPETGYNLFCGISIFVAQTAAVEPILIYSRTRIDAQQSESGIYIGIGARYFIL